MNMGCVHAWRNGKGYSLQYIGKLPGRAEQIELGLLPRIVRIQVGEPLIIFFQVRGLQVFQAAATLVKLRLQDPHILLRKLKFEARHFSAQIGLTDLPGLAANVQRKLIALVFQNEVRSVKVRSRERDCRGSARRKDRNSNLHAKNDVIPLEFVE